MEFQIYKVRDPEGNLREIKGPAGATDAQVIAQAMNLLAPQPDFTPNPLPIDWREAGLGTMAKQGFNRALTGLGSTVTDLIPALAGSALGFKGYAAEQLAEHKAKMEASEAENPTAFKSFRDIRGVGDAAGYVAETFGELIPDIVALMTGAGAASVVGRRVALKGVEKLVATRAAEAVTAQGLKGEAAAAFTKTFTEKMAERAAPVIARAGAEGSATGLKYGLPASSYALNAPDVFQSIYEKTEKDAEGGQHPYIAAAMGVPIAMLDTFLPKRILDKLGSAGKAQLAEGILAKSTVIPGSFKAVAGKELLKVMGGEGLTESAQEALTVAAEMMAGAKGEFFSQENIDRYINAGLKGAIGGGAFGSPGAIRSGLQAKGEKDRLAGEAAANAIPVETPQQALLALENKLFTPVVFPDGSVATTPEQVKEYEESLFQQKFTRQPADVLFTPEDIAAETARRSAEAITPTNSAQEAAGAFTAATRQPAPPLFPGLPPVYAPKQEAPTIEDRQGEPIPQVAPTVSRQELLGLGISKNARVSGMAQRVPLVTFLSGLELDNPQNVNTVITQLSAFAANPVVKPEVKANVNQFLRGLVQSIQTMNTQQDALQFAPAAPVAPFNTPMQAPLADFGADRQRQQQMEAQQEQDLQRAEAQRVAQNQLELAQQGAQRAANERQKAARQDRLAQEAEQNRLNREAKTATQYPGLAQGQQQGDLFGLIYPEAPSSTPPTSRAAPPEVNPDQLSMIGPRGGITKEAKRGTTTDTPAGESTVISSQPASPVSPGGTTASGTGGMGSNQQSAGTTSVGAGAQSGALTRTKENTPVPSDEAMQDAGLTDYEIAGYKRRPDYYRFNQINNGYKYLGGVGFKQITEADVEEMRNLVARDKIQYNEDKKKIDAEFAKEDIPHLGHILGSDWGGSSSNANYKDAAYAALSRKHGSAARMLPAMERILARTQGAPTEAVPATSKVKRSIKKSAAGEAKAKAAQQAAADEAKVTADKAAADKAAADEAKQQAEARAKAKAAQQAAADEAKVTADKAAAAEVQRKINKIALNDKKAKAEQQAADEAAQQQRDLRSKATSILSAAGSTKAEITDQLAAYDSFTQKDIDKLRESNPPQGQKPKSKITAKEVEAEAAPAKSESVETEVDSDNNVVVVKDTSETTDAVEAVEESDNDIVAAAVEKLDESDIVKLEKHYGMWRTPVLRGSAEFAAKLSEDIQTALDRTKGGIAAISRSIRSIIRQLTALILAVSVAFNPVTFNSESQAFNLPLPQTTTELTRIVNNPRADFGDVTPSATTAVLAAYVVGTNDNGGMPFILTDKPTATSYVFDAKGTLTAVAPVLMGAARYADVIPTSAWNKPVAQTTQEEKVTPAGRYEGKVESDTDYGTTFNFIQLGNSIIAGHIAPTGIPSEKRLQRLSTPTVDDNFISYGCLNYGEKFYRDHIEEQFKDGGIQYITPMVQTLEQTFPGITAYSPTTTVVTSIINNPQSATDVANHSEQGVLRQRPAERKARRRTYSPTEEQLEESYNTPLPAAAVTALENNDLKGALRALSTSKDSEVAKLAKGFLNANVNATVKLTKGLKNDRGQAVPGFYDPETNTMHLDPTSMTTHTVLHEASHSGLSHVIEDKNNIVTRQLNKLFNDVIPMLDSAYGAESLQEFVAEAKSNLEFRGKLNAMNPDGSAITAWQRFTNIVGNWMRRLMGNPTRSIGSALDKTDKLIAIILSPAPMSRDGGALYAAALYGKTGLEKLFDSVAGVVPLVTPAQKQKAVYAVTEFLTNTVRGGVGRAYRGALPLNLLADLKNPIQYLVKRFSEAERKRTGEVNERNAEIEPLIKRAQNWAKAYPTLEVIFNNVVYFSTVNGVDPTKKESDYDAKSTVEKGKLVRPTQDALDEAKETKAAWKEVNAEYEKLNLEGQKLYVAMRNAYAQMYREILDALSLKVDAIDGITPGEAAEIKNKVFAELLAKAKLDPYFPLTREGNYWMSYLVSGTEGYTIEAFTSEAARSNRIRELLDKKIIFLGDVERDGKKVKEPNVQVYSNINQIPRNRVPSTSFVGAVLTKLDQKNVKPEVKEAVLKLFVDTLPETAFAKAFQNRKNTPGFERDAISALRNKMYNTSRQLANMKTASELEKIITEAREISLLMSKGALKDAKGNYIPPSDNAEVAAIIEELQARLPFITNPKIPSWSQALTSTGFNMLLGANISSALVNLMQVPMILAPYLTGEHGLNETRKAITDAYKVFAGSGISRQQQVFGTNEKDTVRTGPSIINYAPDSEDGKKYKTAIGIWEANAQLGSSMTYDVLDAPTSRINFWSGLPFHHAERINREVSLISAYNLEMARLEKYSAKTKDGILARTLTPEGRETAAANYAVYVAEMTQGGTSAASAPRYAQGPIGRVLLMFKRYGIMSLYLQFKMLKQSLAGATAAERKAAMTQFAGVTGMAALFAGLQGIPFFGMAAFIYGLFKDDDDDDLATEVRIAAGPFWTYGPVSALTNLNIAGRLSQTDLLVRDMQQGDSPSTLATLGTQLLGPVYGVASKVERGLTMMGEGHLGRGIEQVLPSAFGNVFKAARFATEGANTLRGDPIIGEVNAWNVGAEALGFLPADYARQLEISNHLKGIDKYVSTKETKLLRKYYTATRFRDFDEQQDAREDLQALFRKHPGLGNLSEVISNSMASHQKTTSRMIHGVTFNAKLESELRKRGAAME